MKYRALAGKRIRQLRLDQGFTQEQLSLMTGMSRSNISRIETGEIDIGIAALIALASALDVSPATLLDFPSERIEDEGGLPLEFSIPARRSDEFEV